MHYTVDSNVRYRFQLERLAHALTTGHVGLDRGIGCWGHVVGYGSASATLSSVCAVGAIANALDCLVIQRKPPSLLEVTVELV